jgi:hypothetical protein
MKPGGAGGRNNVNYWRLGWGKLNAGGYQMDGLFALTILFDQGKL